MLAVITFGSIDRKCLKCRQIKFDSTLLFAAILNAYRNIFDGFNFGSAKTNRQTATLIPCQLFRL